jgi:RNA polymerase sigma-70 factor (ECF subfamily)
MADTGQESRWVIRAQSGDSEALDLLLKSVQEPLFGFIKSLVRDHHRALDVLQDVFVLVIRKLYWLREPKLFRPWVYRIASRQSLLRLKRDRRSWSSNEDDSALNSAAEQPPPDADTELLASLPALLEQASPASRAVLSLHYLSEMTLQETADILGISLSAAKSRLAYGLANLRKQLANANPI